MAVRFRSGLTDVAAQTVAQVNHNLDISMASNDLATSSLELDRKDDGD